MKADQSGVIRIAAAVIFNAAGEILLVRKQGFSVFMQPGGKIEVPETPRAALARELREEVGLDIDPEACAYLGRFRAPAAHEINRIVEAEAFEVPLSGSVGARAEIAEIIWVDPFGALDLPLALLSREHIMPAARRRLRP